ncbi:MAG: aminotransferase class V-fold PLP-dependent enzyme [Gammaproteobacteria bacterium]
MKITQSRREFLKHSTAILAGSSSLLSTLANAQATGEDYWQMVRAQFSFKESAVPMNAANLCPSFRAVSEDVSRYTADIDQDCSFNNRAKFGDLLEQSRSLVASQLKVSADEVALVRNTSEANNIVNNGLALQAGDEVLLWDQNHPTNNVAWDARAARFGISVKRVSTPIKPDSQQSLIDSFTASFSDRTRVLSITHVSNVSGQKLPVAELVNAAHQRGIYVHLDGAQSWGAQDLNLNELGVDSYSASAHKWYMGPKEVGLLYVKGDNIDRIWASTIAPGWGNDAETDLIGARKFESLGQRDDAALAALGVAAQIHNEIGPQRIEQRIRYLAQRLKDGIAEAGLELLTPHAPELSHGVCITRAEPGTGGTISNRLYTEFGIAGAATGGVRLCPTIYNTAAHVDRAVEGLTTIMT